MKWLCITFSTALFAHFASSSHVHPYTLTINKSFSIVSFPSPRTNNNNNN